jgi:PAS domain S-box-containing protein
VIFFDENGMPAGVVLSSHDITKRKLAEDKLAASENELRALFAAMTDVVFVLDGEGRYLKIAPTNPLNLYRLPEDMLGKTIHEILPKEIADYMLAKIGEAIQTNQAVPGEYALQIDGKEIWFASSTSRLSDNSVIWVAHDITERKLAEKELEKRTNFLDKLIESSALSTWISDEQGTVIRTNPACLKFFGAAEEEVIGKYNVFQDGVIQKQGFMPDIKKVFEKGEVANIILDYDFGAVDHVSVRNATHKYINAIFTPILDDTGKVTNVVVQSIDLSEIRKAEEEILQLNSRLELRVEERTRQLREAQEELVRKEKLAVLGQLAGGVGHELRNPLGVISNSVYYLKMVQPDANEKIRKHHAMIEQELHNATRIVSDLLDYAREISTEPQPGSVTGLVEHTLSRFPVPASIGIKINIPAGLPQVYADPLHVEQILGNLVTNACQAMSLLSLDMKAGSIPVSISEKLTITARQKKNMLAIAVKDTGSGITPENMQKLFEPLFSTKAKGIGLGLVVSKKLAEANGGRIEVKSQPGKGSTFTLYLPVSS